MNRIEKFIMGAIVLTFVFMTGLSLGVQKAKAKYEVKLVVCDSVEWTHYDNADVYGGEVIGQCEANEVLGRPIPVHIID